MRVFKSLGLATILVLSGTGASGLRAQPSRQPTRAVPGEVIVKFKRNATAAARSRARALITVNAVAALRRNDAADGALELLRTDGGTPVQALIDRLQNHPAVEYAEPNWIYTHQAAPNDPMFGQQWALDNAGQAVSGVRGTADADIDAPEAWSVGRTASGKVYVGVIDEGIDFNHPDLGAGSGGVIWTNPFDPVDGVDNDGNGFVDDIHGWDFYADDNSVYDGSASNPSIDAHGTHVAGTIGARRGNGVGISGVTADVTIIPAKFLGYAGGTTAGAVLALDYLTDLKRRHGLNIVATNNSWSSDGYSQALLEAIVRAAQEDILFIAAAGNGGADQIGDDNDALTAYPSGYDTSAAAGYDAIIAVTATDQSDALADFGNYGSSSVDLGAPGTVIASTTPQNTYSYSSGTSMATPHVTGAAVLAHVAFGITGAALRDALLDTVDPVSSLAGRTSTGGRLNLARVVAPPVAPPSGGSDIVLFASRAESVVGSWSVKADTTAAGGARLQSANLGAAKVAPALAAPSHYFEMTFTAEAGRPYRLWVRGRAENNAWANDSVHVQFGGSVDAAGAAVYRIGTTSGAEVNLEDCSGCGLSGWGWQDNGYGSGVLGPAIYFATTGVQRMRVQTREDGLGIDQIVLSPSRYLSSAPGALKNDTTILGGSTTTAPAMPAPNDEVLLYAADATLLAGAWTRTSDTTAAAGIRLQNANSGAAKVAVALASPADYFELTFEADAGKPYRLWIRGKALSNSWGNDSVHVQFSDAVTAAGAAIYRIGTTSAAEMNLEDCSGCGLSAWGWQDNGYGAGVLGPEIRFATSGLHTIRIQVREDGLGVDQIALSAAKYLSTSPGLLKNDTTIVSRSGQ